MAEWTIEFYEDENGREPVLDWSRKLNPMKERALAAALNQVLAKQGIGVCKSGWGKWCQDAPGIFELRIRHDSATIYKNLGLDAPEDAEDDEGDVLLRVFCHAHGEKVVLLMGGYDKGESPGKKRQKKELDIAKTRLKAWKERQKRAAKLKKRQGRPAKRR